MNEWYKVVPSKNTSNCSTKYNFQLYDFRVMDYGLQSSLRSWNEWSMWSYWSLLSLAIQQKLHSNWKLISSEVRAALTAAWGYTKEKQNQHIAK